MMVRAIWAFGMYNGYWMYVTDLCKTGGLEKRACIYIRLGESYYGFSQSNLEFILYLTPLDYKAELLSYVVVSFAFTRASHTPMPVSLDLMSPSSTSKGGCS